MREGQGGDDFVCFQGFWAIPSFWVSQHVGETHSFFANVRPVSISGGQPGIRLGL